VGASLINVAKPTGGQTSGRLTQGSLIELEFPLHSYVHAGEQSAAASHVPTPQPTSTTESGCTNSKIRGCMTRAAREESVLCLA